MNRLSITIKAIVLAIMALVLTQCGNSGSELKVKGPVILPFLKGRIDLSSLAPAAVPGPGDHIVALALGLDGNNYEAPVNADGSFSLSAPSQPYLVCFYLVEADGTRTFIGSVNYDDQGKIRRFMMVSDPGLDLGLIQFALNPDGNLVGDPTNTPIPPVYAHHDPDADLSSPPDLVPANRIILPQPGKLSFQLVSADAFLMSDLYLAKAGAASPNLILMDDRSPLSLGLPKVLAAGDEIQLAIEVDGRPMGLGVYRHSSVSGYTRVTAVSATSWLIEFEDLPYNLADWDYNDFVVRMTLTPSCVSPDSDGDGLPDCWEEQYVSCGLDPAAGATIGAEQRVTWNSNYSKSPSLAWTGSQFGIAWYDGRNGNSEIYSVRLSSDGVKLGADLRVSRAPLAGEFPALVWTGSEFGVIWADTRSGYWDLYFARISAAGAQIGSELQLTSAPHMDTAPSLSWTGSEFGVAFFSTRNIRDEIYFARVSAAGTKIGSDLWIADSANREQYPSLAWTGSEYGLSWHDDRDGNNEIYFVRLDQAGAKLGAEMRVTDDPSDSIKPRLVWTGSEFGLGWYDSRDGNFEIYFSRISPAGVKLGADQRIGMATDDDDWALFSLAWSGSEYGASWNDNRDGNYEIYFNRISAAGNKIGDNLRMTIDGGSSKYPSLTYFGSGYGVSWQDNRDGNQEIYFARVGDVHHPDRDGDGLTDDQELAAGTNPCLADTDGDGMPDGWEVEYAACASLDPSLPGDGDADGDHDCLTNLEEYLAGANPCHSDVDRDGDGVATASCGGSDCDDNNPNVWSSCGLCRDADRDGYFAGCDAYITIYGPDCNDNNPTINPGAFETFCDGIDQNCNGMADDNGDGDKDGLSDCWEEQYASCGFDPNSWDSEKYYAAIGAEVRLTFDANNSYDPTITWTGSEFGVGWTDTLAGTTQIYFTRLSKDGVKVMADLQVTSAAGKRFSPALAWTGSEFGLSWEDYRDGNSEIYFARVSAAGAKIGADVRVTYDAAISGTPSLAWTGSEFGVAWNSGFARLTADGNLIGSMTMAPGGYPSLAWTGSEFGVGWMWHNGDAQDYEAFFSRVSAAGAQIGADLQLTDPTMYSWYHLLVWTGSEFGMVWQEQRLDFSENMYFARISAAGAPVGSVSILFTPTTGSNVNPALTWTGSEFAVSWGASGGVPANWEIFLARFTPAGVQIGPDYRVSFNPANSDHPSLAWTGSEFGLTWNDLRDGNREIYFARVGARYTDKDGDGLNEGEEYLAGTNPCLSDTDGDGMSDGDEVAAGTDPLDPLH